MSTHATGMTTALTRNGEYVSISGATATEYAAQVAPVDEAEEDSAVAARDVAGRADRDERDAGGRDRRGDPEARASAAPCRARARRGR